MDIYQFSQGVVRPALMLMDHISDTNKFATDEALELLIGTAVHESGGLKYFAQRNSKGKITGPAISFYQIEPNTLKSIHNDFVIGNKILLNIWNYFINPKNVNTRTPQELVLFDMQFATVVARLRYYWSPKALPPIGDVQKQARYWKKYWNTPKGKGLVDDYVTNFNLYAKGKIYD